MIVTLMAVFFTVSRTSILLVFVAIALLVLLQASSKYRFQLIAMFIIAFAVLWFFSDNIFDIVKAIVPSITQRTDTVGLRYALWKAGWRMWLDHPLKGVGIGMFPHQLRYYGQDLMAPRFWRGAVAHNMYVQVLAETGALGFIIFAVLLILSVRNFLRAGNVTDQAIVSLRSVWLVAFLVMLFGGITKTDQADKMLWLAMGASVYFNSQVESKTQEKVVVQAVHGISV
jgi:O-antigen ligase